MVLPATELNMLHFWVYKPVRSSENRFSSENKFAWSGITCNKTGHVSYEEAKKVVTKLDHKLDSSELKWTQDTPGVAFWNFLCIFPFYWMKIQLKSWIQDWVFNSVYWRSFCALMNSIVCISDILNYYRANIERTFEGNSQNKVNNKKYFQKIEMLCTRYQLNVWDNH